MTSQAVLRVADPFEIRAMETLPCGCVAVAYEARSLGVLTVNLEAKGPHCVMPTHAQGRTLQVGEAGDLDSHAPSRGETAKVEPEDALG